MKYEEKVYEGNNKLLMKDLEEIITPRIYLDNPFRILELQVEATQMEIQRQVNKLKISSRLGSGKDEYTIQDAGTRLNDPIKRLIYELFWFWPRELGNSKNDKALEDIKNNNINNAITLWQEWKKHTQNYVSVHNLAVVYHCLALDLENKVLNPGLSKEEYTNLKDYWESAVSHWRLLLNLNDFWNHLNSRINALSDPRLKSINAQIVRDSLFPCLILINASLAFNYAEKYKPEEAKRQLEIMKLWEGSRNNLGTIALNALEKLCNPLCQRIEAICNNVENQVSINPNKKPPIRNLIEDTKSTLSTIDILLPKGNSRREIAHDTIAKCALHCIVQYANNTEDYRGSLELFEMILPIAEGQEIINQIKENIKRTKDNIEAEKIKQKIEYIMNACNNAKNQVDINPSRGDEIVRDLIEKTKPLLLEIDGFTIDEEIKRGLHDRVADCALYCIIRYANNTEDLKGSLELLEMILPIAKGQEIIKIINQIKKNIAIIKLVNIIPTKGKKDEKEYNNCWFCGVNRADEESDIKIEMYKGSMNETVYIPRCIKCKSTHHRQLVAEFIFSIIGMALGFYIIRPLTNIWVLLALGILLSGRFLGFIGTILFSTRKIKALSHIREFPQIKQLISQGWKIKNIRGMK